MGAGENFLILNFLDDYFEAALLRADFSKKNLVLISLEKENYESRDKFKKIFRRAFPMRSYKVILALDSKRAFTGHWDVSLVRDNREGKITQADLENFVSQAIWKVFDNGRKMSGSQLGLNDADSLLVDTRIYDFKIDGRRVIDPLKHDGGKFDVSLSQTFTSRLFMEQMSSILPKRAKLAFILESGIAASRLLSRMDNKKNFIFAKVMKDETDIFISKKERKNSEGDGIFVSFLDYFEWGANDFYRDLGKEIAAEPEIAEAIAETFFTKELSPALERRLENILSEKMLTLNRGLANAAAVAKCGLVYLDFPPASGSALRGENFFHKIIRPISSGEMAGFFGFSLVSKNKKIKNADIDFLSLSAIMEFYFLPQEDLINHYARRRMRWLTADN